MKLITNLKETLTNVDFWIQVAISLLIEVFLIFPLYKFYKPLLSSTLPKDIRYLILLITFMLVAINAIITYIVTSNKIMSNQITLKNVLDKSLSIFATAVIIINLFAVYELTMQVFYLFLIYVFSVIITTVNIVFDLLNLLYQKVLVHIHNVENKVSIVVSLISLLVAALALLV